MNKHDERLKREEENIKRNDLYGASGPGQTGAAQTREGLWAHLYRRYRIWMDTEKAAQAADAVVSQWKE
jgi:hypothetical protein